MSGDFFLAFASFSINTYLLRVLSALDCLPPTALAAATEDCTADGEWPSCDKEVIFDGTRVRPECGDVHPDPAASPVGRLRAHKSFWLHAMHAINTICTLTLSIIETGYRLPWNELGPAPAIIQPNHRSSIDETSFVSEAVAKGISLGTWKEVDRATLKCIMPLGVATHGRTGKKRLIFDCRHLNRHLETTKFKMEGLHTEGRTLFQKGWFGGTIDLTSAYYHIEMHPSAYQYLGFEWKGRYYHYTVLPFGISTAPYIFTKVMKTTVGYMRSLGYLFIQYLDDLPFAAPSASRSTSQGRSMINILRAFGWLVHLEKCVGIEVPVQCFEALGSVIDLLKGLYRTPIARVERALTLASSLLSVTRATAQKVAQVKGLFVSMWLGTGEHARIRTRSLGKVVDSRLSPTDDPSSRSTWRRKVLISDAARAELKWWQANLTRIDGRPIQTAWLDGVFDGTIATDASDTGFGGWVSLEGRSTATNSPLLATNLLQQSGPGFSLEAAVRVSTSGLEAWGALPEHMQGEGASSTLREMYGAFKMISRFSDVLQGGRFRLHLDNICCVMGLGGKVPPSATGGKEPKSVLGGSRVDDVQKYIIKILDLAHSKNIQLVAVWVPRAQNERSDLLSRHSALALADYCINDDRFAWLDRIWGVHTLDAFSTSENVKVKSGRFMSRFYHPQSLWVDSLSVRWPENEMIWAHPPPRLVGAAIRQFQASCARGTLVVPQWPTAAWWPMIYPDGSTMKPPASFIMDVQEIGRARSVLSNLSDHPRSSLCSSMILALRIDCRRSEARTCGPGGAGAARAQGPMRAPPAAAPGQAAHSHCKASTRPLA